MIHFKNRQGFTLIEAMIAIAIVALTITPMFILQTNVFTAVSRLTEKFHRLIFAKNFIFHAEQKEPAQSVSYSIEKKEEHPLTMVRYTLTSIAPQSSLSKVKRLYRQEVAANGLEKDAPAAIIVQFFYKPKEAA